MSTRTSTFLEKMAEKIQDKVAYPLPSKKITFLTYELHTLDFAFVSVICNLCIFLAAGDRQDFYFFFIYILTKLFGQFFKLSQIEKKSENKNK